jgi:uncharacterized short protein YbdD (DUF466 family)
MGKYYDMVKANFNKLRNDEGVMWGSIEMWDEYLEEMREHHPDKYWEMMRRTHEMMYGKHFDKEYAEWEVAQMHHKSPDGKVYKGEHWSMEQTTEVMQAYKSKLNADITPCDFYVALNAEWHDYICWAKEHFPNEADADNAIIEMAVRFWFLDDDWGTPTKVWEYFRAKNVKTKK